MNYSDQLRFIASALLPTHPAYAAQLEQIAIGVRRLEITLDEITNEALEEERLRQAASDTVVVHLNRFRRVPIRGDVA